MLGVSGERGDRRAVASWRHGPAHRDEFDRRAAGAGRRPARQGCERRPTQGSGLPRAAACHQSGCPHEPRAAGRLRICRPAGDLPKALAGSVYSQGIAVPCRSRIMSAKESFMKITSFEVIGLNGRTSPVFAELAGDLNILTGRNGSGKTTILKLMWYIISGNILLALQEVDFQRCTLVTDIYRISLTKLSRFNCKAEMFFDGVNHVYEDVKDEDDDVTFSAEDEVNPRLIERGSSVFFPTFRRIEGGFGSTVSRSPVNNLVSRKRSDIEEALASLSRRLTNDPHTFVASISTVDIVGLLLRHYANMSEEANTIQQGTSQEIIETIKHFKNESGAAGEIDQATRVIDSIRNKIEGMEAQRELLLQPIQTVTSLVERLFRHSGISFGSRLSVGDAAQAVNSESLSAGEKQMLSFICYNTFYSNCVVFIDEPELSLHVDWQRQLFPTLLRQKSQNQFIIATHSPFIYTKYPDKEVNIDVDRARGDEALSGAEG